MSTSGQAGIPLLAEGPELETDLQITAGHVSETDNDLSGKFPLVDTPPLSS